MHKPDRLLELDVKESLGWDPELDESRVVVNARDGHVTLSGSVATYSEKVRATDDAWTVAGVKALDNELLVGVMGAVRDDLDLAAACRDAVDRERAVPDGSVTVTVHAGYVVLRGT